MYLPIKTMKTAGPIIPTNGIRIEGSKLEASSLVITYFNKYSKFLNNLILFNDSLFPRLSTD